MEATDTDADTQIDSALINEGHLIDKSTLIESDIFFVLECLCCYPIMMHLTPHVVGIFFIDY